MITGKQLSAARALAGMTICELSVASTVARGNISRFEHGRKTIMEKTEAKLIAALELRGIRFLSPTMPTPGVGVALVEDDTTA